MQGGDLVDRAAPAYRQSQVGNAASNLGQDLLAEPGNSVNVRKVIHDPRENHVIASLGSLRRRKIFGIHPIGYAGYGRPGDESFKLPQLFLRTDQGVGKRPCDLALVGQQTPGLHAIYPTFRARRQARIVGPFARIQFGELHESRRIRELLDVLSHAGAINQNQVGRTLGEALDDLVPQCRFAKERDRKRLSRCHCQERPESSAGACERHGMNLIRKRS